VTLALLDAQGNPTTAASATKVVLSNAHVKATFSASSRTFALTSLVVDGAEAIAQPSLLPQDYADQGGLWRTGNEMSGCTFAPQPTSLGGESVVVLGASPLSARVAFVSQTMTREASLAAGATGLEIAVTTGAAQGTTRTMSFGLAVATDAKLATSLPGGFAERPLERIYTPTFWPAVDWAKVGDWAILLRQSTGVRMSMPGEVELMAARDARAEQCDVEGGVGSDAGMHRIEWRIEHVASVADAARKAQAFDRPLSLQLVTSAQVATTDLPASLSLATIDGDGLVSTIKPADRGGGVVVRALLLPGPATVHLGAPFAGKALTAVDLAERDGTAAGSGANPLPLDPGQGTIQSFRVE
jgi:hypothetical protein